MKEERNGHSRTKNVWKIAIGILCSGILVYGWRYSDMELTGDSLPSVVGYCLPSALLIWAVVRVVILRGRGARVAGLCFLAIYGASIGGAFLGVAQQKAEARQAISDIHEQWDRLMQASADSHDMPTAIEGRVDTTTKARGQLGEMEKLLKEFMAEMLLQRNDYLLELGVIGWNEILDAERIANDSTLVESRMIIRRAEETVKKYERKTSLLLADTQQRIQTLAVSSNLRQEMTSGFDRGMREARPAIDTLWALEKQVICEFEKIVDLLAERAGKWVVSGGRILFYDENDLRRFNCSITTIQRLAAQQDEIRKRAALTVNRNFDALREIR